MIRAGRVFAQSSGPLRGLRAVVLLSGCLQLADFVAVGADGRFPARTAIDEAGVRDQAMQRFDPLGLGDRRQCGDADGLAGFNPCLP
jgi:hypothetical protein